MKASPVLGRLGFRHVTPAVSGREGSSGPTCLLIGGYPRTLPFSLDDLEFGGISESCRPPGNPPAPNREAPFPYGLGVTTPQEGESTPWQGETRAQTPGASRLCQPHLEEPSGSAPPPGSPLKPKLQLEAAPRQMRGCCRKR